MTNICWLHDLQYIIGHRCVSERTWMNMGILSCLCFSFQGYVIGNMISILSKTIYYLLYNIYILSYTFYICFLSHSIHNGFNHSAFFLGPQHTSPPESHTAAFAGPRHPWQVIGTSSAVLLHLMRSSMDWFKGKYTGKPHISWENRWFPVKIFP